MVTLKFSLSLEAAGKISDLLACLAKFNETVFLEAKKDILTLSTLNTSKSAYAAFNLDKSFFMSYSYMASPPQSTTDSRFTCSMANRALTSVFRSRVIDSRGKDPGINRCDFSLHETEDVTSCRLVVKLICTYGVTKTYRLTYESVEVMHALFDRGAATNKWSIRTGYLREFLDFFAPKAEQLDIYSEDGKVTFISFTEKVVNTKSEILKHPMKTSIALDQTAFESFDAQEGIHTIFSVKDFRAVVIHAGTLLHSNLSAYYSSPGRPLQFFYAHEGMQCQFTLMTASSGAASDAGSSRAQSRASSRPGTRPASVQVSQSAQTSFAADQMPPPPTVHDSRSRRAARQLGQSGFASSMAPASAARPQNTDAEDSLFVERADDDARWDPADHEDEGMNVGWNANADLNDAPFGSVRDTVRDTTAATSRVFSVEGSIDVLPPTQRISQIKGLW